MKNSLKIIIGLFAIISMSCNRSSDSEKKENYAQKNYNKQEATITMRDGIKLFVSIYSPKDVSKTYPILLQRTPYSCAPYGKTEFRKHIGPNETMMKEGYIIVYEDVRGRWMSEGTYDNMRPYIPNKKDQSQIDESSDTYDTIDWLVKNVANNNGKVGTWGISYPGFYTSYSTLDAHPALKAASPQAPIGDFFFDDFHHNGAFLLSYFRAIGLFGAPKNMPTDTAWYKLPEFNTKDQYQFFLEAGPISNLNKYYESKTLDNTSKLNETSVKDFFWQEIINHPNYDENWQKKSLVGHLKNDSSKVATMVVGGWYDAEDLYGTFETYKHFESNRSRPYNTIVVGPWSHGGWAREPGKQSVGNVYFGDSISTFFQKNIETKFFHHFLKEKGDAVSGLPEAYVFDTGAKVWQQYAVWPPKNAVQQTYYLKANQELSPIAPTKNAKPLVFVSDLTKPVPYSEDIKVVFTPRKYMTDDQRFAARRPDVLVYQTPVLERDMILTGDILAKLQVATTGTDADWIVKVIDVFPPDAEENEAMQDHLKMSNYFMLLRSEVMRGKFRNSFSNPQPMVKNQKTEITIHLQDVYHTLKEGHRLQIQIQSTWFPLIDLNPQTFVENIYKANASDFKTQTHSVYQDSEIIFNVMQ
ncbi:MAG: X-Pro dipeptidyl-peptidase [Flavobacteriales bacterium CG03_land_8_20_14_0_80_35_15]|nr:MAG: X-Pro dipeptidyl-peptidase [Flavobacteriales bacterium CG03_land_8_20_14_0_80_35_15]PIX06674.1 MAG: X-Pro dipeptidyl-peptidase [Flavobacteriales bacterium CG_4_8_14_3_um_filter_35_10]PJA06938.1 MAG: X-Pro dipeptidyl-peptidase [Flavobacteriales bacterium CG_4_10_14_0_2_um_filter_35_18]